MTSTTDWTDGYHADIGYTYGYYSELNPLRVRLMFLNAGLERPDIGTACELGFGQGLTVNIHAAASPTQWYGTDFNPSQAGFAQGLTRVADSGARLFDDSFGQLAARNDLPDFDYIGLHGIWSWISDDNRKILVDFIARKLKVGGVLYISYNTLPGWSRYAPLRHLFTQHAHVVSSQNQGILSRVHDSLAFTNRLMQADPLFARANPQTEAWLKELEKKDPAYLAHEYFNRDWEPMYFSTMATWLDAAKLQFACSCNYEDHFDHISLSQAQREILAEVKDPVLREDVRDFILNRQFRRDYWVKGARAVPKQDVTDALRAESVVLAAPRRAVSLTVGGPIGTITMRDDVCNPILDQLADHSPKTLRELEMNLEPNGISLRQIRETVLLLAGSGYVTGAQNAPTTAQARPHTDALNAHLMHLAHSGDQIRFLASPVTGGGLPLNFIEQLFLEAHREGEDLSGWVDRAWSVMNALQRTLLKDDKPLTGEDANRAELKRLADQFRTDKLPMLQALQMA